ncbi:MAG: aspartate/glutamate racemase family protein, partial [Acidobacteria bacterium]|nr:aspartate/glutamate racemase family protein [Acidobacteriota bacterium]
MKTAGLAGGIAPESTIDYYRSLIAEYRARVRDDSYPLILINSIDLTRMLGLVVSGDLRALADHLTAQVMTLARAGADFAAFASNTPHIVFDDVRRRSPLPMISIVEATCDAALESNLKT